MKKTFLLLLASLFLTGCSAQATKPVVPIISTPLATATEMPLPTLTLQPTSTLESTQTLDPILATREAALASCQGNGQDNIDKYITQAYSATRFWSATVCQDDGIYTKVEKLGKDKIYKIPALDLDPGTPGPDLFWEPYLWSVDGNYLYLRPRYVGVVDSPGLFYSSGFGLTQLDLDTGARNVLLQPRVDGYTFALSEDGRLFAYLTDIPRTINVLDLKTKEKHQLSFKERYNILQMRWTPDGAKLIILTEESAEDPAQGGFSIFEYNTEGKDLIKLVEKNNLGSLYSPDPSAEHRIFIAGLSNTALSLADMLQQGYFDVNLESGEVLQTNDLGTPIANP
jgi:hypothetical protein